MARASSRAWMDRSSMHLESTSTCLYSATLCIAHLSRNPWRSSSAIKSRSSRRFMQNKPHTREIVYERSYEKFTESSDPERTHESTAATYAGTTAPAARDQFQRSEPGISRRTGTPRGATLPGMRKAGLRKRVSGRCKGERVRPTDCCWRLSRGGGKDSRRQRPSGRYGPGMPTGRPLRGRLSDGQENGTAGRGLS